MTLLPVFIYNNMRVGFQEFNSYLKDFVDEYVNAYVQGYEMYNIGSDAGAIPGREMIYGDLLFVKEDDYYEMIKRLDILYGYMVENEADSLYIRKIVDTVTVYGVDCECYFYEWNGENIFEPIYSGDWLEHKRGEGSVGFIDNIISDFTGRKINHTNDRRNNVTPITTYKNASNFTNKQNKPEEKHFYFAYGSNLNKEQMKKRCPNSKEITTAILDNHELVFKANLSNRGVADVINCEGSKVFGAIYEITDSDMEKLDKCEGVPNIYQRNKIKVRTKKGVMECWVYKMNDHFRYQKPFQSYFDKIKDGFINWDIPDSLIDNALGRFYNKYKDELEKEVIVITSEKNKQQDNTNSKTIITKGNHKGNQKCDRQKNKNNKRHKGRQSSEQQTLAGKILNRPGNDNNYWRSSGGREFISQNGKLIDITDYTPRQLALLVSNDTDPLYH